MALSIVIKRGDTRTIVLGLSRSDGSVVDLSGATGRFFVRKKYSQALVVDEAAMLDDAAKTASCEVTLTEVGVFFAEVEVLKAGKRETFPAGNPDGTDRYVEIIVPLDLGDAA